MGSLSYINGPSLAEDNSVTISYDRIDENDILQTFTLIFNAGSAFPDVLLSGCSAAPGTPFEFWRCGEPFNTADWTTFPATSAAGLSYFQNKLRGPGSDSEDSGLWAGDNIANLQKVWIDNEVAPGPGLVTYARADIPGAPVGVNPAGQAYNSVLINTDPMVAGFFAAQHVPNGFSVEHRIVIPGDDLTLPPGSGDPTIRQVRDVFFGTAGLEINDARGSAGATIDRASNGYGVLSECGEVGFKVRFEEFDGGGEALYIWDFPHPGDINRDGSKNSLDFAAFQQAFNNSDPVADMNGDRLFNSLDFVAFQTAFAWTDPCGPQ